MRRLALIASVLLGASSTAALAGPFTGNVHGKIVIKTDNHNHYNHRGFQARRWDHSRFRGRYNNDWMMVGDHLSAQSHRQFINLGYQPVDKLVIQAESGAPRIVQVAIDFGHDDTQVVKFDQRLGRFGNDSLTVDVNGRGRPVNRIVVYTDPRFGGSYSVLAR